MITLAEIQGKYPTASYAPDPDCKRCDGTGTSTKVIAVRKYGVVTGAREVTHGCACIFLHSSIRELAITMLSDLAKRELRNA